ncbi:hypothetical protein A0H81_06048 [Grifola frondosa]|uniref:Uncharacterized protein n=1 Tax=Grifola frondosa TaxID=5627 RepID=A0A1C7MB39_GRIFR|nr:hypothetical protein A0H81_06048 [Grifola frondosa]
MMNFKGSEGGVSLRSGNQALKKKKTTVSPLLQMESYCLFSPLPLHDDHLVSRLNIVKLFCETLVYGFYCVVMAAVLYIVLTARHLLPSHKGLFLVAFIIVKVPISNTQASVAIAQFLGLLGDSILIWRVWIVWNKKILIIVFPVLATVAAFVIGIISAAVITSVNSLNRLLPVPTGALAVNSILCSYLEWRMAQISESTRFRTGRSYGKVILLVIESGAILASANIIALVLEKMENPGLHVILDILAPLLGLVPTLIVVLSHIDLALGNHANERCTRTVTSSFAAKTGSTGTTMYMTPLPTIHSRYPETIAVSIAQERSNESVCINWTERGGTSLEK